MEHSDLCTITVTCPVFTNKSEWGLNGQSLSVGIHVTQSVDDIKKLIVSALQGAGAKTPIPGNKFQLKFHDKFIKDKFSAAHYNIGPHDNLIMSVKTRGGRR